jgi:hypothetical protein
LIAMRGDAVIVNGAGNCMGSETKIDSWVRYRTVNCRRARPAQSVVLEADRVRIRHQRGSRGMHYNQVAP